jgi:hypothetical protein
MQRKGEEPCQVCVDYRDELGSNYIWLQKLGHGSVEDIWFEEPVDSNNWTGYDKSWWETHCLVVSHGEDLVESHFDAFVDPETRFARLMFLFKDRTLMEPTKEFYELEFDYFHSKH